MRGINFFPPVQQVPLIISPLSVNYISLPFLDNHCYFRVSVMHPGGWRHALAVLCMALPLAEALLGCMLI